MLYLVATPIGNLQEITYRAVAVLKEVDLILAEDTRHSAVLLRAYDVRTPCLSYQKFNERSRCAEVIERLRAGQNLALISDAGMPLISDPGSVLLREVIAEGLPYTVISGPCAAVNAVVLSGLPTDHFCMVGFLPEKTGDRKRLLDKFRRQESTLIFYVSPHAIDRDLAFLADELGGRQAALVREISKVYEEVVRFMLGEPVEFTHKGEFVLVVAGAQPAAEALTTLAVEQHLTHYLAQGLDRRAAVKQVAADRKVAKSVIYAQTLSVGDEKSEKN